MSQRFTRRQESDSANHNDYRPSGTLAADTILAKGELKLTSGNVSGTVVGTAMGLSGAAGLAIGGQFSRMIHVMGEGILQGEVPQAKQAHIDPMMKDVELPSITYWSTRECKARS